MSTPNYKKQRIFDLYATEDSFLVYPYETDDNDDCVLDENGNYLLDFDAEPYFDYNYFEQCENYTKTALNRQLKFFKITFEDGYYAGVQTIIKPKNDNFDALDFLQHPQYYDNSELFSQFGVNTYILKKQIAKEINNINNDLLPELAKTFGFNHLKVVAQFSNGETMYEKV